MPGGTVSDELVDFHRRVAAGGAAMSTVAYLRRVARGAHRPSLPAARQGDRAGPAPPHRRRPRGGRRGGGPDRTRGTGGQRPLQPCARALALGRLHPHGLAPACRGRRRDRAHRRGLPPRRCARGGGGLRLHRGARRPQLPLERLPQPEAQPPRRPVRRIGGEPRPLRPHVLRTVRDAVGPDDGGHGEAQHGRRRGRGPVARRERRDRLAVRSGRRARCAGAHGGQLAAPTPCTSSGATLP